MTHSQPIAYDEAFRPQYHFSPPIGWMNDPNGLVYVNGEYHLFFQYHPYGTTWSTMHWGHAVSPDLIHWENLPIAIYPDEHGAIFSGSAVFDAQNTSGLVPSGGLIAVFSYQNQTQGIAYSTDGGRTWTIYAYNPVLENPGPSGDFRDPKVFQYGQYWIMVIAAKDRVRFYKSANLIEWTYLSEFGETQGAHGGVWECPDVFPLEIDGRSKWVLIVSVGDGAVGGGSGTQYFIGDFDGTTFKNEHTADTVLWLDYGPDNYAAVSWNHAPNNRPIVMGWMNNWRYANLIPTSTWRGAMTLPRTVELAAKDERLCLVQTPLPALETLRERTLHLTSRVIQPDLPANVELTDQTFEIVATLNTGDAASLRLTLHQAENQLLAIGYDCETQRLFVDRQFAGVSTFHPDFAGIYYAPLVATSGDIRLRIFVDWSSIEVFGNNGESVITCQMFPERIFTRLELASEGGTAQLVALDVHNLKRIWSR